MIVKGVLLVLSIAYCFYGNLIFSIFISPVLLIYLKGAIRDKKKEKKADFTNKFKDGMMSVSFSLDVGYSIENAFYEAYKELEKSLGSKDIMTLEFKNIVIRLRNNENIEMVIEDFANRSDVEDIRYFAEVFKYAKRSGGNLIEIIKNTARQIQEKCRITSEIQTMISGKKMEQKVMSLIPIIIVIYLKITTSGYLDCLYGNPLGIIIMTICLCMYGFSVNLANNIMDIEV